MIQILPVINAKDFEEFKSKAKKAEPFFDLAQIDIMDGNFVATKSFGDAQKVKDFKTSLGWELHLMVQDVEKWVGEWILVPKVKRIIFHIEPFLFFDQAPTLVGARGEVFREAQDKKLVLDSSSDYSRRIRSNNNLKPEVFKIIQQIKKIDIQAGLALNPETPLEVVLPYLSSLDIVLLLTVPPGKSGQKFMKEVIHKIKNLRQKWPGGKIEVDGGINPATAKKTVDAGANVLASGSYLYSGEPMAKLIREIEKSVIK